MENDRPSFEELEFQIEELKKQNERLHLNGSQDPLIVENSYRLLFENSVDGFALCQMIFERDLPIDFIYLKANPAFERITGLNHVIGHKATEIFPDIHEKNSELLQTFGSVATSGEPQKFEVYFAPLNIWLSISVICPEKGYFIAIFDDITSRKQAELAAKENVEKFKTLFEYTGSGNLLMDINGVCLAVNKHAAKMLGSTPEQIVGKSMFDFLPHETATEYLYKNREKIESGLSAEYEDTFQLATGTRTFLITDQVLKNEHGQGYALLSSSIDITDRKSAENVLKESEEMYRLLTRNLPGTTVFLFDHNLRFILIEGYLHPEFGFTTDQMKGKTLWDVLPKERAEAMAFLYRNALQGKSTENYVSVFKDHCFSTNIVSLRNNNGEIVGGMAVSQDITELKQAENKLKESERTIRKKLDAMLSPEGDISMLNLADIIDSQAIQAIMDDFFHITHIGVGLIDLNGKVLVANGWQDICTKFHRVNPETCKNCVESDTTLTLGGLSGKSKKYKCKNNLWDISTPIFVGGRHLGNIFLGQFFYEDETIDIEVFRNQARKFGFNEEEYLNALDRVPRWSREEVESIMRFYSKLSLFISNLSYGNLKLAQTLDERNKAVESLQANYSLLRIAGKTAKFGGWSLSLAGNKVVWSDEVAVIHEMPAGYSLELNEGINFYAPEWRDKITPIGNQLF